VVPEDSVISVEVEGNSVELVVSYVVEVSSEKLR